MHDDLLKNRCGLYIAILFVGPAYAAGPTVSRPHAGLVSTKTLLTSKVSICQQLK